MRTMRFLMVAALVGGFVVVAGAQPGRPGGGGGQGPAGLILIKGVQDELKLTDDQVEKIKSWSKDFGAKRTEIFKDAGIDFGGKGTTGKGGFTPEMAEKMAAANAKVNAAAYKDLEGVLKPEQVKRLKQIEIQAGGIRAFTNPDVVAAMKFTDEQKSKLKTIATDFGKDSREAMSGVFGGGKFDPEKMAEANKKVEKLEKEAFSEITAMLTDDQKKAWKELTGEPFDRSKLTQPMRKKD